MAMSRYNDLKIVKDEQSHKNRVATFPAISAAEIQDASDVIITYDSSMRLDQLAAQYLGDGRYWWAICLANDIHDPFSFTVGSSIRIPSTTRVLNKIAEKANKK